MAILNNSNAISPSGYDVNNSLRFRSSASAYLNRTPASSGTRTTWTWSGWVKRGALSVSSSIISCGSFSTNLFQVYFDDSTNTLRIQNFPNSATPDVNVHTTQVFRDPSAWYHIVVAMDTTQATSSNRVKIYINGSQVTAFSTATYPAQNATPNWNTGSLQHNIGARDASTLLYDGYIAEAHFIDGSAKTPSDFGETDATTGVWKPKAYTGTYGTNGFYLKFSDIATTSGSNAGLGKDFSGNTNYWTTNNISVTSGTTYDAMTDSPTNTSATVANYAVMNPLDQAGGLVFSEANLKVTAATGWDGARATFSYPSTGKYYWEATCISRSTGAAVGILGTSAVIVGDTGNAATGYIYNSGDGNKYNNGSSASYGATWAANDIIGIAWDADAGSLVFYKNNTSQGTAWTGLSGTFSPTIGVNGSDSMVANFGQRPFAYTPPTGFVALNTFNLPDSTIKKGSSYMDAYIYTGDGNSTRTITFPIVADFVWSKNRTTANDNVLIDTVRGGTSPVRALFSNAATAEITTTAGWGGFGYPDSLSGTSYAVVKGTQATSYTNKLNDSYVNWLWQAGQGSTSSNTSGSITSTVSVNATAGFSVVTYTGNGTNGASIGHGLGVKPSFWIIKQRTGTQNWLVWHKNLSAADAYIILDSTGGQLTNAPNIWTADSSKITFTTSYAGTNNNTSTYVAYCWAEIAGFSKAFSYTGNASTDGPFVFCNFRPRFILFKNSSAVTVWIIFDTARNTYNFVDTQLRPNASDADNSAGSAYSMDILSNGFKVRSSDSNFNGSGNTIIGMAFAENPFKNSNAR